MEIIIIIALGLLCVALVLSLKLEYKEYDELQDRYLKEISGYVRDIILKDSKIKFWEQSCIDLTQELLQQAYEKNKTSKKKNECKSSKSKRKQV